MAKFNLLQWWVNRHHLAIILLLASAVTHFAWLNYPAEVIFDEVHFGKFITAYCCTKERFFDIHPPHAKLLIAGTAYLLGYRGQHTFEHIGQPYGDVSPFALLFFPAAVGTILPLLVYILLRRLKTSPPASFFGGALILFDNAVTVQTRIIALDGLLLAAILGSLFAYLSADNIIRGEGKNHTKPQSKLTAWCLFFASGGLAGLAVGSKFTGLVAGGLIVAILTVWCFRIKSSREILDWIRAICLVSLGAVIVYTAGWALHFAILQKPGSGDAWRVPEWKEPIILSFYRETMAIQKIMYRANSGLTAKHHDASPWWTWPLMETPVYYWQYNSSLGNPSRTGSIYFIGNPLLWWSVSSAFVVALLSFIWQTFSCLRSSSSFAKLRHNFGKLSRQPFIQCAWLPILGYFVAYVPLMSVSRVLFLYHYLTPLFFSIIVVVIWLDSIHWFKTENSIWRQPRRYYIILGLFAIFFLLFSPLTYGLTLPPKLYQYLFWFKTWH